MHIDNSLAVKGEENFQREPSIPSSNERFKCKEFDWLNFGLENSQTDIFNRKSI
jgi:hypothetical protein